ncbi:C4-dicarboxylate TRAP transporter substrate-binding protein [uncultured Marinobacter sp.]|uniref:C4-dicarboxylate TRAP transporter substrate-binding protein n=1 Tax=uncultured Marinobacter sp. TaxID=187379 RepID=UPI0030DD8C42
MGTNLKKMALASGLSVALAAGAGFADARELRFASGATHGSIGSKAVEAFTSAAGEKSGGDVQVRAFMQSLLSFMETPSGLRDGLADIGAVLTPYFSSDFPATIMITELTMLLELDDVSAREATYAFSGAISEFVFQNCPECVKEYSDRNQVFLGIAGSTPYNLLCNTPVRTADEMRGKRIRIGGPQWSRWATEMGASPVSMAVNDTYEGLGQGVIDCTAHNLPDLTSFNFIEVISDVTLGVPGGIFGGIATHANRDTWTGLAPDQREAVMYASAAIAAELAWLYAEDHDANLQLVHDRPDITVHEADEDFRTKTREFIEKDMVAIADRYKERHNLNRADEMVAEFRVVLDRWLEITKGVETNTDLTELYWNEVFSKVDVNSYGLR